MAERKIQDMKLINRDTIEKAAGFDRWVDAMESAFRLRRGTDYLMPKRSHIDFDQNTLLLMPCIGSDYFATKLVSVFPANAKKGKPQVDGVVVLNSMESGEPLAVFDGAALTAMRTAAVGSFGIRHLAPKDVSSLGMIGAGKQGNYQALAAFTQRKFDRINIHDRSGANIRSFITRIGEEHPGIDITVSQSPGDVCLNSYVIITATNSNVPVLPDSEDLLRGKTFIGIGSYKPDMREFPDALFRLAGTIFIDTEDGISESGDLIYPLENNLISKEKLVNGYQLLQSKNGIGETRVFKSVGMALFDLYAAELVYRIIRDNDNS